MDVIPSSSRPHLNRSPPILLSNRIQVRPLFASKNDPSDGAKTGRRGAPRSGGEPVLAGREWRAGGYARFLKRQLSLPVSMMSQWWVSRSSMAVVIFASPNTSKYPYSRAGRVSRYDH